jgi:hypothetical protein
METLNYDQLDPVTQEMVRTGEGWGGTAYTNKDGVKVTLHGDGEVAKYSVEYPEGHEPQAPVTETVEETPAVEVTPETESVETTDEVTATETEPTTEPESSEVVADEVTETTDTTETNVETEVTDTETAPTEPETV